MEFIRDRLLCAPGLRQDREAKGSHEDFMFKRNIAANQSRFGQLERNARRAPMAELATEV
jgi:hypothetical protein